MTHGYGEPPEDWPAAPAGHDRPFPADPPEWPSRARRTDPATRQDADHISWQPTGPAHHAGPTPPAPRQGGRVYGSAGQSSVGPGSVGPGPGGQVYGGRHTYDTGHPYDPAGQAHGPTGQVYGATGQIYGAAGRPPVQRAAGASGRASVGVAGPATQPGRAHPDRGPERPPRPGGAGRRIPARTPARLWLSVVGGIAVVVLVATVGAGAYLMVHGTGSAPKPRHDIASQLVDPAPLTTAEVFPADTVAPDPTSAYPVVKSQASDDCKAGAVGDLATALTDQGCTQVVRATLTSPDGTYVLTAGLFNLRDEAAADRVSGAIPASLSAKKGRITGYDVGGKTASVARSGTELGWDTEGHFLAYCVVARADGKAIGKGDPTAAKIINDLVETDLKGTVLAARMNPPVSGSPAPRPS